MTVELSLWAVLTLNAQGKLDITGTITDSQTGEPVIGAVVMIKGTQTDAVADANGTYTIKAVDSKVDFPQNGFEKGATKRSA